MLSRKSLAVIPLLITALCPAVGQTTGTLRPPNFIVILADDLGYGDLSCYGQKKYRTPALDQMASEGVKLTQFYVTCPACSPSRASLLTGRYPTPVGVPAVLGPAADTGLVTSATLISNILKDRGYMTSVIGKWHIGSKPEYMPLRRGFDEFFGLPYSNDMKPAPLFRDDIIMEAEAAQDTLTRRYTSESLAFIDRAAKSDKPFFLYLAHTFPHIPLHVSKEFKGKSRAGLYGDVITELDWSVGEILGHLQQQGLAESTLVLFMSDNGPWTIKGSQGGSPGPLRGSKGTDYEGGIRVPFIAWWPGHLPAGTTVEEPAIILDIMPTLAKLSNVTTGTNSTIVKLTDSNLKQDNLDGRDIWPLLSEGKPVGERTFFFPDYYSRNPVGSIRKGDYKLIVGRGKSEKQDARTTELINLKDDPREKHNLAERHPDMVESLAREADVMRQQFIAQDPWHGNSGKRNKANLEFVTAKPER